MFKNFEDVQKLGKEQLDAASALGAAVTKGVQQIATETTEYSKKSVESASAAFEKLVGAKSIDVALQVQGEFAKASYESFIAQSTKMGELYAGLAKEIFKPVEAAVAKATAR
ncbi:MAG: phasin family protein [Beijerinckiaceae bacterium]|jgi:hypothetical protein